MWKSLFTWRDFCSLSNLSFMCWGSVMRASMVYIYHFINILGKTDSLIQNEAMWLPFISQGKMGKTPDQVAEPWARKPSTAKRELRTPSAFPLKRHIGSQEAPPRSGQIAQGHGWNKYLLRGSLLTGCSIITLSLHSVKSH